MGKCRHRFPWFFCMYRKQACKRSSVFSSHLSRMSVAGHLKRFNPETGRAAPLFPYSILLQMGFTEPDSRLSAGELLPRLSTLTGCPAVSFCGTCLGVASTGRYPASCPAEPRLSSRAWYAPATAQLTCFSYYREFFAEKKVAERENFVDFTGKSRVFG